jgi:hypothetical protein
MSDTERERVSALTEPALFGELGMRRVIFVVIAALMFATTSRITHSPVEGLSFATSAGPYVSMRITGSLVHS